MVADGYTYSLSHKLGQIIASHLHENWWLTGLILNSKCPKLLRIEGRRSVNHISRQPCILKPRNYPPGSFRWRKNRFGDCQLIPVIDFVAVQRHLHCLSTPTTHQNLHTQSCKSSDLQSILTTAWSKERSNTSDSFGCIKTTFPIDGDCRSRCCIRVSGSRFV